MAASAAAMGVAVIAADFLVDSVVVVVVVEAPPADSEAARLPRTSSACARRCRKHSAFSRMRRLLWS